MFDEIVNVRRASISALTGQIMEGEVENAYANEVRTAGDGQCVRVSLLSDQMLTYDGACLKPGTKQNFAINTSPILRVFIVPLEENSLHEDRGSGPRVAHWSSL